MADRPILFSGPMVRALLAGTKTQTRRTMNPQPELQMNGFYHVKSKHGGLVNVAEEDVGSAAVEYLRIAVGDRLWVKETSRITSWGEDGEVWMTYAADDANSGVLHPNDEAYLERLCARIEKAGAETDATGNYVNIPASALVKPSIFMPRWASRLTLTVSDVRVERLQDISQADAKAEGVESIVRPDGTRIGIHVAIDNKVIGGWVQPRYSEVYETLWEHLNGAGSWNANPWVAAYTFTVHQGNIDAPA